MCDEIKDCISKLKSFTVCSNKELYITTGENLMRRCLHNSDDFNLIVDCEDFLKKISSFFIEDIIYCYGTKK